MSEMRVVFSAVCALAAHAVLYWTVSPGDSSHSYFSWYQPVSVLSLAVLLALLAVPRLRCFVPWRSLSVAESTRSLAASSFAFLVAQESIERTLASARPAFASFTPAQWLVVLLMVAVAALALSFALRAVVGRAPAVSALAPALPGARWSVRSASTRRPRALAGRFAWRAPPPFGLT
jgi:hypothetical protein